MTAEPDTTRAADCLRVCAGLDSEILRRLPVGAMARGISHFTTLTNALKDVHTLGIGVIQLETARARLSHINTVARAAINNTNDFTNR